MSKEIESLKLDVKRLEDDISHLHRCIEAEKSFQNDVLALGMEVGNFRNGEGVCVGRAMWAIKCALEEVRRHGTDEESTSV